MLLYNWTKIFKVAQGSAAECFRIIKMLTLNELPSNRLDPIYWYSAKNFSGDSFLLNPEGLVHNSNLYSKRDLSIYAAIASQRALAEYRIAGTLTLELVQSRIDPSKYLDNKTLIPVYNGIIHFPYEE